MSEVKRPTRNGLKSLARIRLSALGALSRKVFAAYEIGLKEANESNDLVEVIRGRGNQRRFFRVPTSAPAELRELLSVLKLVDIAATQYQSLVEKVGQEVVDEFALRCFWIGNFAGLLDFKFVHQHRSKPKRSGTKKLTDPKQRTAAEKEIKNQLRGKKISFSAACDRASGKLRDIGIEISGRSLRDSFSDLKPKK